MNYTKNYRLPQWVKEDRIMMDDFNAMNTSIESGLSKTAAEASAARADAANADIERIEASNGDVYFFSTRHLEPAYAQSLAEWASVERFRNV